MHHQPNPFIQHAVQHGQALLGESARAAALSQNLVSACDEIMISINSGNPQSAAVSVQNARNMALQVAQANQHVNAFLNERMDMAYYIMSKMHQNLGEVTGALQGMRSVQAGYAGTNPIPMSQFQPPSSNYTFQ